MKSVTGSNEFRIADGSEKGGGFIFPPETASAAKNTQRGHFLPGMLFFFVLAAPSVAAETEAPRLPIDEVVVTAMRDSQDPLKLAGSGQEHLSAICSPVFTGPGSCGAFLFLEDGVAIRPAGFCNVNQLMEINSEQMQAVEVIRGPGSALYGANALHGLLNFLTPAGSPSGPSTSIEAGPDNYYRVKLDSGGLSGDWRLLANGTHDGGARADSGYDQGKLNLFYRHQLVPQPIPCQSRRDLSQSADRRLRFRPGRVQGQNSQRRQ